MESCPSAVNRHEANQNSTRRNSTECALDHFLVALSGKEFSMGSRTFMSHEVTCTSIWIKLEDRND